MTPPVASAGAERPAPTATLPPIAIIGVGCVLPPDSVSMEAYWANVMGGVSGIAETIGGRWDPSLYVNADPTAEDKTHCQLAGLLDDYTFPVDRYDLTPQQRDFLRDCNRTQLLGTDVGYQALASSAYDASRLRDARIEVFVGNMIGDERYEHFGVRRWAEGSWELLEATPAFQALSPAAQESARRRHADLVESRVGPVADDPAMLFASGAAPTIVQALGLNCPATLVDGACASGLLVVDSAVTALLDSDLDVTLAIAVMANLGIVANVAFDKLGGLTPHPCRPLADSADGLVPGEGAGAVLLKRLDRAMADGDRIYGVIRGAATRSDGAGKAIFAPASVGQVAAMRRALDLGGLTSRDLDYVETHATGTPTGDVTEVESLDQLVTCDQRATPLPVGSGKALIGHGFPAAGMANLLKILAAFDHGVMPPVFGVDRPNKALRHAADRLRLVTAAEPWPAVPGRPRRALTNAFGFGGVDSTVVVEQFDPAYHGALPTLEFTPRPAQPLAVIAVAAELPGLKITGELPSLETFTACLGGLAQGPVSQPITDWRFPLRTIHIPPTALAQIDRAQQLFLVQTRSALLQAGLLAKETARQPDRIATIVGGASGLFAAVERTYRIHGVVLHALVDELLTAEDLPSATGREWHGAIDRAIAGISGPTSENALAGYMDNIVSGRAANRYDLRGANFLVDADRASFGAAARAASQALRRGDSDFVVLGGAHSMVHNPLAGLWRRLANDEFTNVEASVALVVCHEAFVPAGVTPLGYLSVGEPVKGRFPSLLDGVSALGADGAVWVLEQLIRRAAAPDDDSFVARATLGSVMADFGWPVQVSAQPLALGQVPVSASPAARADSAIGAARAARATRTSGAGRATGATITLAAAEDVTMAPAGAPEAAERADEPALVPVGTPTAGQRIDESSLAPARMPASGQRVEFLAEAETLDGLLEFLEAWSQPGVTPSPPAAPPVDQGFRLVFRASTPADRSAKAQRGLAVLREV